MTSNPKPQQIPNATEQSRKLREALNQLFVLKHVDYTRLEIAMMARLASMQEVQEDNDH